ncbi:MAG: pilus assembly protein PilM [Solirubrobacterales bacterium]
MARGKKKILALDIGTRSIVGVLLEKDKDVTVHAVEVLEHETRSMFDGQIHDVEAVAEEIATVKARLEEKTGLTLKQAAVAAAGRALKTARGSASANRPLTQEIKLEEVQAMELEAVQQAQLKIAQEEASSRGSSGYFCVGYSVVTFYLEDQPLQNLVGQIGKNISVEVIATFLPRVVVDSLFSAVRKANLDISSMTLEPIAALAAAIPTNMRLLNLALVDIGAGTSDIAVVNKGNIFAYAMVPMGGDEVTEAIAEQYLLDFNSAERVKCQLNTDASLTFSDVLENEVTCTSEEVITGIKPVIRELANRIAFEIMTINQKRPDAVICVGGGSMTPTLLAELAAVLELPANRVGVRTREALTAIKGEFKELTGPRAITPIGIGINALNSRPLPLIKVRVNDREMPLWGLNEITVGSALLASGVNVNNIYGRPGMGLSIEVNGVLRTFRGELGLPPVIMVNGAPTHLDTPLKEGDRVEFERGEDGTDARITVRDLLPDADQVSTVTVNGAEVAMLPLVLLNGESADPDQTIPDRAKVEFVEGQRLAAILERVGVAAHLLKPKEYRYKVNGEAVVCRWPRCTAKLNGEAAELDCVVRPGSKLEYEIIEREPNLAEVLKLEALQESITIQLNQAPLILPVQNVTIKVNSEKARLSDTLQDESDIFVKTSSKSFILSDLLRHMELPAKKTGRLILRVNGVDGGFTTPVKAGDSVEIYWVDSES